MSLLRNLPDRGYPFARFFGVFLMAFLAWTLSMWQLASFGRGLLVFCLLTIAAISGVLLWKDRTILSFFREHWRLVLAYELLFIVALVCGALLRIHAPWGGVSISHTEQPMDFALMNGIIQSRNFPPQDPWLSDYSINYYYQGYLLAAALSLLSGISSSIVFNLNMALIFALAVVQCFSVAYNLTMAAGPALRRRAIAAGILAAVFFVVVGNQIGAFQVLTGSNQMAPLNAGELWTATSGRLFSGEESVPLGHTVYIGGNDFGGQFDTIHPTQGRQRSDFDWWWPSRVLWDERPSWEAIQRLQAEGQIGAALFRWRSLVFPAEVHRSYTITEFPFFSFYLGDMHPHVMALPLTLLAVALSLNVVLAPERGRLALGEGRWSWFFLALNAVVLGGLYMTNSWDLPTYLLLYGAAWIWRWRKDSDSGWTREDWKATARDLGLVIGLCILLYLPFFITFRSLVGSKAIPTELLEVPVLGSIARLPILSNLLQTAGPVLWDKTSLHTFLIIFGLFLYPALTWLIAKRVQQGERLNLWGWIGIGLCLGAALLLRFPLLVLLPALWIGWELLGKSPPAEAMVLFMLVLALLLVVGCEFIYIRDIFESRMNTIFKFYYQVWMLLAIVGAWAAAQVGRAYLRHPLLGSLWTIPAILLLLGASVYPVQAIGNSIQARASAAVHRLAEGAAQCAGNQGSEQAMRDRIFTGDQEWRQRGRGQAKRTFVAYAEEIDLDVTAFQACLATKKDPHEWSLDGLTHMKRNYPNDYAGVQWLWENAEPDATILEAVGPEWGYHGRISAATGLPTLLGWDGHEYQWRGGHPQALAEIDPRRDAANLIYQTTNIQEARGLLDAYEVDYVFLGALEAGFSEESRVKFAQLGTLAFEAPGVQIFRIHRSPE
jgi:YYY domain-containing protein